MDFFLPHFLTPEKIVHSIFFVHQTKTFDIQKQFVIVSIHSVVARTDVIVLVFATHINTTGIQNLKLNYQSSSSSTTKTTTMGNLMIKYSQETKIKDFQGFFHYLERTFLMNSISLKTIFF